MQPFEYLRDRNPGTSCDYGCRDWLLVTLICNPLFSSVIPLDGYILQCRLSGFIIDFKCVETEKIWQRQFSRKLSGNIQQKALHKLQILDAAVRLENLRVPPGNRLDALKGDRKGQHSIRINRQWRICFKWMNGNAHEVEIADYH